MTNAATIDPGKVRPAAVAGRFYPSDPVALRKLITGLLASVPPATGPAPKALIAPHAGYLYSGPIAASAYAQLIPARDQIAKELGFANRSGAWKAARRCLARRQDAAAWAHIEISLLDLDLIPADEVAAQKLNLPLGHAVWRLRRLRAVEDGPLALMCNLVPEGVTDLTRVDLHHTGLYEHFRSQAINLRVAHQVIGARTVGVGPELGPDQIDDPLLRKLVEGRGGLVQQQNGRTFEQRSGDGDLLPLPAGQQAAVFASGG